MDERLPLCITSRLRRKTQTLHPQKSPPEGEQFSATQAESSSQVIRVTVIITVIHRRRRHHRIAIVIASGSSPPTHPPTLANDGWIIG